MSLSLETSIQGVIDILSERVAPAVEDHYILETIRMAQSVLRISAHALDDAVLIRVEENAAQRALFADAAGLVAEPLAATLAEAGGSVDPDLRINSLDAENARLRTLLVQLHAVVEVRDDEAGRAINQRIWALLQQMHANSAPRA